MTDGCWVIMSAHKDRSTIKPSLIVLQCFELGEKKESVKNKVTSHAAKYHFSEDKECSTDGAEVAVGFKETSFCLKSSSFFFFFSRFVSHLHTAFLFLFIFIWKSMSGHTLKAAQTVSTSQYKCTDSLKSVHKQPVKLLIFFFFFRFYTVSFIYNKITHLLLYFIF